MRAITVHGVALGVMLVLAYRAWTPDQIRPAGTDVDGSVVVWEVPSEDIRAMTYVQPSGTTVIERREELGGLYLWGRVLPAESPDSTGVMVVAEEGGEFPIGVDGEDVWERLATLRALRDVGVPDDSAKTLYELVEPERVLTISAADGERVLQLGGMVYANNHRFALEPATGRAYVISGQILRIIEGGATTLRLRTLHRFGWDEVTGVTVRGPSSERAMARRAGGTRTPEAWVDPDTPDEPDQTFENFMNRVEQLAFAEYEAAVGLDSMEFLVRIDYAGEGGEPMGFLELYRTGAGEPGLWDYYMRTEATRIPAQAHRSLGERVALDLADLF